MVDKDRILSFLWVMIVTVGLLISNHYRLLSLLLKLWKLPTSVFAQAKLWKLLTKVLVLGARIESHVWILMRIWLTLWIMIAIEELFNPSDVYFLSIWIRLTMTDLILWVCNRGLTHYYILVNLLTPMRRHNATFWSIARLLLYVRILKVQVLHLLMHLFYQRTIASLYILGSI